MHYNFRIEFENNSDNGKVDIETIAKINKICKEIYHAKDVVITPKAKEKIDEWKDTWWDGTAAIYSADRTILKGGWSLFFDDYILIKQ